MKILHTADWHMNNRLGYQDLSGDIVAALEQIADYLEREAVDVLLVAGDLFSEKSKDEGFQIALWHLRRVFGAFVARGGTVLGIAGNHDPEMKFESLRQALLLSSAGSQGRFFLTANPQRPLTLGDKNGQNVQFVLLPYPTPRAYLDGRASFESLEEKNRLVQSAFGASLERAKAALNPQFPTVLVSHVHIRGAQSHSLYEISESEDVIFDLHQIPSSFAYAAYGHIHRPGSVGGAAHIRYSGSPIQLDAAEKNDQKSCVLFEISGNVLVGEPQLLPLKGPQIHQEWLDLTLESPEMALARLLGKVAPNDLVWLGLKYKAAQDLNLRALRNEFREKLGRVYAIREERLDWHGGAPFVPESFDAPSQVSRANIPRMDVPAVVREYLTKNLENHSRRAAIFARVEELLARGENAKNV